MNVYTFVYVKRNFLLIVADKKQSGYLHKCKTFKPKLDKELKRRTSLCNCHFKKNAVNRINCFVLIDSSPYVLIVPSGSNKEDSTFKINCLHHDNYIIKRKTHCEDYSKPFQRDVRKACCAMQFCIQI